MEALVAILSGGATVAVIEGIREAFKWRRERRAVKEDRAELGRESAAKEASARAEERLKTIEEKLAAQSEALMYILYDRIRYLVLAYIADGAINFDDRRILNDMYRSYHKGLNGNGDLEALMSQVNKLPIKNIKGGG